MTPGQPAGRSLRIVSLLAAGTEIVHAVGAGDSLVGISHECDHPPGIEGLPRLTRPRLDPAKRGAEIDGDLRALVDAGTSPYEIDAEALRELRPDLIVTQDQCRVCAVSSEDLTDALGEWTGNPDLRLVSLRPFSLDQVWNDFLEVGRAVGRVLPAEDLVSRCRERLGRIASRMEGAPRIRTLILEWMDPLFLGGGWAPDLIRAAGGEPVGPEAGGQSPQASWERVLRLEPDALFVAPCGYPLDKTWEELGDLTGRPGWSDLPAVRAGRTWAVDGNALLHRSGPRLVESVEVLAGLLHPDRIEDAPASNWARRIG